MCLRVKRVNGDLLVCDTVVDENLKDIISTALDVSSHRGVWANKGCWLRTERGAHSPNASRVSCAETAGVQIFQRFRHFDVRVKRYG